MAFPDSITLKDAANADNVFVKLHDDKTQSLYVLTTAPIAEPVHLVIQKDMAKTNNGTDRFLAKLQATVLVDGVPVLSTRNISLATHRKVPAATNAMLLAFGNSFSTEANLTKQLRGEI